MARPLASAAESAKQGSQFVEIRHSRFEKSYVLFSACNQEDHLSGKTSPVIFVRQLPISTGQKPRQANMIKTVIAFLALQVRLSSPSR